ncbi:putative E3 ubiquitin-protein ligase LIN-1 [Andrographis paniculata]|uniref:putative E3 ubiquitin-protein ligase LIN-1 n=1 Tax=Andrographis paniculata TaxID=175694 RepID=UPI0021E93EB8|nr:putative E3 ubiquitin-protein ligase LIN-1 [Andrographis paniculata]
METPPGVKSSLMAGRPSHFAPAQKTVSPAPPRRKSIPTANQKPLYAAAVAAAEMSATTTSSVQILHHTASFFSEIVSQPDHRHHLFSAFLRRVPASLVKPLNLAAQTLERAISTTSNSVESSSLRLAEKLLLSNGKSPFSSFFLSLVNHLSRRPIDAAVGLLDAFHSNPSLFRLEIAPSLFQELFLVHFPPILEWYKEQRSTILSTLYLHSGYNSDDQSIVSTTTLLSKMSGDQASALGDLEKDYEDLLDENCRVFVEYFKEVLRSKSEDQTIVPPQIVLQVIDGADKFVCSNEERINGQDFGATNRRYNPMWAEGERSVELSSDRGKSLSRFPSFFPERVSPKVLTNLRSSKDLETSADDNSIDDYSSSDSDAGQEENIKKLTLFDDSKQMPSKEYKQLFSEQSSRSYMEDGDHLPSRGKRTAPKDFVCPITTHIFDDPVTLETGQTYERKAIQEWLERGNSTCPITRQKLHSTQLPKTNYVLKRLIYSWLEQNPLPILSSQPVGMEAENHHKEFKPSVMSVSPNSVISQAAIDGTITELRLAITDLCTSEILMEAEKAVLKIQQFWQESNMESQMQSMLVKPPVVNGFVEVMFSSLDIQVLRAAILLLTELGSRDASVIQTLTRVDSDVECIVELFKKGLTEAAVLVLLLRPSATSLVEMDIVDYLLPMVSKNEDNDESTKLFMKPKSAAVVLLGHIIRSSSETNLIKIVRGIISSDAAEIIVDSLKAEDVGERIAAVSILARCIYEDGKCRNVIAQRAVLGPLMEIFVGISDDERFEIVNFLYELIKLNRRNSNEQLLHILKEEGTFSAMHSLLIYLQHALPEQSPVVAGLLLQLDLLDEPRKMSIYREEAIDALISCLRNSDFPAAQVSAAETLLALQGRFSYSGKSLSRAILLKRAGFDRSYRAFLRKDQRRHNIYAEPQDIIEEEKAAEEWERKMAYVLVSHEFGIMFEALAEGLTSKNEELRSVCFMTATWLVYMVSLLPDTGIRGTARVCLLKHFVSIFISEKNTDDVALSMLALYSFIHVPEGLQDLSANMKDILKILRELKKSSTMASEMLKIFSEEHDNSADIWTHNELSQEDCSINGEVLVITCFKAKIFSGHSDGTIKIWTIGDTKLQLIQEVRQHTKPVTSLAILHSSDKLCSGSLDRTVRVWTVTEDGIYCEQVHEMKEQINDLVVANSMACYIPQGAGVKVHTWNGSSKLLNQHKYVKRLALVQGKLYCGCHDNSIQEIDLVTGTVGSLQAGSKKLLGKAYPIHALQVHDGLIYAASTSLDGGANIKIWSASNYNMVGSLSSTLEVRTMAVSSELIYLGSKGGTVEVWCRKKYSRVETLQTSPSSRILSMAIDDNEDMLIIGTSDGRIQTWGLS